MYSTFPRDPVAAARSALWDDPAFGAQDAFCTCQSLLCSHCFVHGDLFVNLLTRCLIISSLLAVCSTDAFSAPPSRGRTSTRGQAFTVVVPPKIRVTDAAGPGSFHIESTADLWMQVQGVRDDRVVSSVGRLIPKGHSQKITPNAVMQHSGQIVVTFAAL